MAIFDFLKKKTASIPLVNILSRYAGGFLSSSSNLNPKEAYIGWVYSCVRAISEEVAKTNLVLTRTKSNGDTELVNDHPAMKLLQRPNDFFTKYTLFERMQSNIELCGNEYWFVEYKGNIPFEIFPLMPDRISPIPDKFEYIKGYQYNLGNERIIIPKENIIHHKTFNASSDILGMSTLEAVRLQVETDEASKAYNRAFFKNSAQPGAIIEVPGMSKNDKDKLKDAFNQEFRGASNAYRTAVIGSELKIHPLQMTQADMQFIEQRKMSRDEILAIFRVPKTIIGILEDTNFASAKTANYVFALRTILPKLRNIQDTLNYQYLPLFRDEGLSFEFLEEVPEDEDVLIKKLTAGISYGFMSINDARRKLNLPEIVGGESVMLPLNLVPFGEPEKKKSVVEGTVAKEVSKLVGELFTKEAEPVMSERMEKLGEMLVKQRDARGEEGDRSIRIANKKLFKEQQERIIKELEANFNDKKQIKAKVSDLFDKEKEVKLTIDLFTPIFAAILEKEGEAAHELLGLPDDFTITPNLRKFLKRNTKKFAREVNNNTAIAVRASIASGLEQGEGLNELKDRIKALTAFNDARVEMIARSETIRAQSKSELEVWKESEVVEKKIWFTAEDQRVCPFCNSLHGKELKLSQSYFGLGESLTIEGDKLNFNYETVTAPPLHPSCRCTLIPVVSEGKQYTPKKSSITDEDLFNYISSNE